MKSALVLLFALVAFPAFGAAPMTTITVKITDQKGKPV